MPLQGPFIYFFNNRFFLLASLVGFEPARQMYIASQKPNTLPTELSGRIMAHLDEHRLLSDKQHAFGKWHSCEIQLITVIDDWAKILDNQGQVDTFILDFEKSL